MNLIGKRPVVEPILRFSCFIKFCNDCFDPRNQHSSHRPESRAFRLVAVSLLLLVLFKELTINRVCGQCTGTPEWQFSYTNRMRCGVPGYLTNDTYYFAQSE